MPITASNPFKWRQHLSEVIRLCVRWCLRFPLSYPYVIGMMQERCLELDRSCVWCWVQNYAPELNKRCLPHLKPVGKSLRVDETYVQVKNQYRYLYRAVDNVRQMTEFLLTAREDAAAAN